MESDRIEYEDKIEYRNEQGLPHRLDGPALEWFIGTKVWYINGLFHREDGPAIEFSDGDKEYYLNDIQYSEEEFHKEVIKLKLKRLVNENRTSR